MKQQVENSYSTNKSYSGKKFSQKNIVLYKCNKEKYLLIFSGLMVMCTNFFGPKSLNILWGLIFGEGPLIQIFVGISFCGFT